MKLLGIDYGAKRVGLAISDDDGAFAFPHSVVATRQAIGVINQICQQEGIATIVIGESLNYQGHANPIMDEIKPFVQELHKLTGLPVVYEREFMTSLEAQRIIGHDNLLDARAAALILKSYIDRTRSR